MAIFGISRSAGSESSAWAVLGVLGAIQVTFQLMPHHSGWPSFLYAMVSIALCVIAIGVAAASFDTVWKQGAGMAMSLLLASLSMSHLIETKVAAPINIAEPTAEPVPEPIRAASRSKARGMAEDGSKHFAPEPSLITHPAAGMTVESRIDDVGGLQRLSWKLTRGGMSLRCGPLFTRTPRPQAEETLRQAVEFSLRASAQGELACP